jgi:hypothetical protein
MTGLETGGPNNAKPEHLRVVFFSFKLFFVDVSALIWLQDYAWTARWKYEAAEASHVPHDTVSKRRVRDALLRVYDRDCCARRAASKICLPKAPQGQRVPCEVGIGDSGRVRA